ncbi:maltose/maltodextrin ABC transporter [Klebsiella pneumoniae]|uniref:Maltose/maltodextrin ABC transporter n=1 Tax=Klebsiella pneumoniae TaxID=573 RepID=A0A377ZQJ6_KLEPN|nr:maltose/maltodextrin ABC transporter [Klebsiella pneumoniae]
MDRSFQAGKAYNFTLIPAGDEWKLALTDGESGKNYLSDAFKFGGEQKLALKENRRPARRRARQPARDYPESHRAEPADRCAAG